MTTITNTVSNDLLAAMNPASTSSTSATDATQDKFLTLLVTQLQNQDPLNPMDNAQVTSQMAQLSTVTGIDKLNSTLTALMGSYKSAESVQATSMIGHGVLVPGSSIDLSGGKAVMGIDLPSPADSVKVTIYDGAGKAVQSIDLGKQDAGVQALQWDGSTDAGGTAKDGSYTFEVKASVAGTSVDATALAFGQVGSVTTSASGVKVNVGSNIGPVNLADVRQII